MNDEEEFGLDYKSGRSTPCNNTPTYILISILFLVSILNFSFTMSMGYLYTDFLYQGSSEVGLLTRYLSFGSFKQRPVGYSQANTTDLNGKFCNKVSYVLDGKYYYDTPTCIESRSTTQSNGSVNNLDTQFSFVTTSSTTGKIRGLCQNENGWIGIQTYDNVGEKCLPAAPLHNNGDTRLDGNLDVYGNTSTHGPVNFDLGSNSAKVNGNDLFSYDQAYSGPLFGGTSTFGYSSYLAGVSHRFVIGSPTSNTLPDGSTFSVQYNGGVGIVSGSTFYTSGAYTITSDSRMKKSINDTTFSEASSRINSLKPKTYMYNDLYKSQVRNIHVNNTQYGFIAQDLLGVYPSSIYSSIYGNSSYYSLDMTFPISDLVVIVKGQNDTINTLKNNYISLSNDYNDIKNNYTDLNNKYNLLETRFQTLLQILNITIN